MMPAVTPQVARAVLLHDLALAGVHEVSAAQPFDFYAQPAQRTQDSAPVQLRAEQGKQIPVVTDVLSQPAAKTEATHKRTYVQTAPAAQAEPLNVVHSTAHLERPLALVCVGNAPQNWPAAVQQLWANMLNAIALKPDDFGWVVLHEDIRTRLTDDNVLSTAQSQLQHALQPSTAPVVVALGQAPVSALCGAFTTLSDARTQTYSLGGRAVCTVYPPQLLLDQPMLKRMAWQDLLRLQDMLAQTRGATA